MNVIADCFPHIISAFLSRKSQCGPYLTLIFIAFFTAKKPQAFVDTLRDLKAFLKGDGGTDNPFTKREQDNVHVKVAPSNAKASELNDAKGNNSECVTNRINEMIGENGSKITHGLDKEEIIKQIDELMAAEANKNTIDAETIKKIETIKRMAEIIKDEEQKMKKANESGYALEETGFMQELPNPNAEEKLSAHETINGTAAEESVENIDPNTSQTNRIVGMKNVLEDYGHSVANTISSWAGYLFRSGKETTPSHEAPIGSLSKPSSFDIVEDNTERASSNNASAEVPCKDSDATVTPAKQSRGAAGSTETRARSPGNGNATSEDSTKGWWGQTISRWAGYVKERVDEMERQNELDRLRYAAADEEFEDEELDENESEEGSDGGEREPVR